MKLTGGIHHIALKVNNLDTCATFYQHILGLTPHPSPLAPKERSRWFQLENHGILMLEKDNDPRPSNWNIIAFRIVKKDQASWRSYLQEKGVTINQESDYTIYIQDPEGNRLGLSFL